MNNQTILRVLGLVLTAALLLGCVFAVSGAERVEPPDPREKETSLLRPEALSTGRAAGLSADPGSEPPAEEPPAEEPSPAPEEPEQTPEPSPTPENPDETPEPTPTPTPGEPERSPDPSSAPEDPDGPDGPSPTPGTTSRPSDPGGGEDTPGENTGGGGGSGSGSDPGGNTGDDDGDDTPEGPSIITDLGQYTVAPVSPADLTDGMLAFYARAEGGTGLSLEVRFRHEKDDGNGSILYVNGRQDYKAPLQFGRNYITITLRQNGKTLESKRYTVQYIQKADRDNPETGHYPPSITMAAPDESRWPLETSNHNFSFEPYVTDTHTGKRLTPSKNMTVVVRDGYGDIVRYTNDGYVFDLWLERPNRGDTNTYTISITAWDEDGCSARYKEYILTYHAIDTGDEIGKATIVIDATTVGMGVLDTIYDVPVQQDVPISSVVLKALSEYGYSVNYNGTEKIGFYIRSLDSGSINVGAVPERLWTTVERDGIGIMYDGAGNVKRSSDSLGEFDFTRGSGWMYSINGSVYADKGMSERYLQDGDVLYLRFTLAYGKDIGGYSATGGSYGQFSTYCYRYIGGSEIFIAHDDMEEIERQEPTETEDGYILRECVRCGEQEREVLPATGPTESPEPSPSEEPTPTPEPSPTQEPTPTPTQEPTPTPTQEPTPTPEPAPTPTPSPEATPTPEPPPTPTPAAEPPKPEEPEGGNDP